MIENYFSVSGKLVRMAAMAPYERLTYVLDPKSSAAFKTINDFKDAVRCTSQLPKTFPTKTRRYYYSDATLFHFVRLFYIILNIFIIYVMCAKCRRTDAGALYHFAAPLN